MSARPSGPGLSTVAYFDVYMGISGDMVLGSLVDVGLQVEVLQEGLDALGIAGLGIEARRVSKHGLSGTKVDIVAPHEHVHRGLAEIVSIIGRSDLPSPVQEAAAAVFERLAAAEARVHGTTIDEVHFHEVGAADAIGDIVGAVYGLHALGVQEVHCSPIPLSRGTVHCAHGEIPVPPPAVLELLAGLPVHGVDTEGETVTPTGAALMVGLADRWGAAPAMTLRKVGYGAGDREYLLPNMLRLLLGDRSFDDVGADASDVIDQLTLLETNIDDMSPEWLGPLLAELLGAGAVDAWFTPIVMKKGRPAIVVSALTHPAEAATLRGLLFSRTTTLGIRESPVRRRRLERQHVEVETPFGPIRLKVGRISGGQSKAAPEFDDCHAAAKAHGVSLQSVYAAALAAWIRG